MKKLEEMRIGIETINDVHSASYFSILHTTILNWMKMAGSSPKG